MNKAVENAKAVLDKMRLKAEAPFATFDEKREFQALDAMTARAEAAEAALEAMRMEPTAEEIEAAARLIAYEMGDTMGDSRAVFWSGYSFKDAAMKAAKAVLLAARGKP